MSYYRVPQLMLSLALGIALLFGAAYAAEDTFQPIGDALFDR